MVEIEICDKIVAIYSRKINFSNDESMEIKAHIVQDFPGESIQLEDRFNTLFKEIEALAKNALGNFRRGKTQR